MPLIQVGLVALRSPAGEFLPGVPIMREVPANSMTVEITERDLEKLFADRIKQYINAKERRPIDGQPRTGST